MDAAFYLEFVILFLWMTTKAVIAPGPSSTPPKHAFPLTNWSLGYDVENGVRELYPAGMKQYEFDADIPVGTGFESVIFDGSGSFFIDVPVSITDPTGNHYYTVTLYVNPASVGNMSILAYESDDVNQGMVSMELWTSGTNLFAELINCDGVHYSTQLFSNALPVGQWTFVSFMRDQNDDHQRLEIAVDATHDKNFPTTTVFISNHRMHQSGKLRIGGSFRGRKTFSGKISCVMVVEDAVKSEADNIGKAEYCVDTTNWKFPPADYFLAKAIQPSGYFKLLHTGLSPNTNTNLGQTTVLSARRCVDFCMRTTGCASVLMVTTDKMCILYERHEIYSFVAMANTKYYIAKSFV